MNSSEVAKPHETDFHPDSVAVVATTLYPNWEPQPGRNISDTVGIRGDIALETVHAATDQGFRTVISDGGSSPAFLDAVGKYNASIVSRGKPGRGEGRRQGITFASELPGVKAIVRTEPEKLSLVADFIPDITRPLLSDKADIVVPQRTEPLFGEKYPDYMHVSEVSANNRINALLQKLGYLPKDQYIDFFFGPIALKNDPKVLDAFMEAYEFRQFTSMTNHYPNPENHSNAQAFPVLKGLISGEFRVKSVPIDFIYPPEQKTNEDSAGQETITVFLDKRRAQRFGILDEVIHYIRLLHNDPKSRLLPLSQEAS